MFIHIRVDPLTYRDSSVKPSMLDGIAAQLTAQGEADRSAASVLVSTRSGGQLPLRLLKLAHIGHDALALRAIFAARLVRAAGREAAPAMPVKSMQLLLDGRHAPLELARGHLDEPYFALPHAWRAAPRHKRASSG